MADNETSNNNDSDTPETATLSLEKVRALTPKHLQVDAGETEGFAEEVADLVEALVSGDLSPDEFQDELVRVVNAHVNIPVIPEYLEAKAFHLIADGIVAVIPMLFKRIL